MWLAVEVTQVDAGITSLAVGDRFAIALTADDAVLDQNSSIGGGLFPNLLSNFTMTAFPTNTGTWVPSGTFDLPASNFVDNAFGNGFTFQVRGTGFPDGGPGLPFFDIDLNFAWLGDITDSGLGDSFAQQLGATFDPTRAVLQGSSIRFAPPDFPEATLAVASNFFLWTNAGSADWTTTSNWRPHGQPTSAADVHISNGGTAQITTAGAQAQDVFLGQQIFGGSGHLEVAAVPASLSARRIVVGDDGTGTLSIAAGGAVSATNGGDIGIQADSTGAVTVTGAGSAWTNAGSLELGESGDASLSVSNGAIVTSTTGELADDDTSNAVVTVTGVGSMWSMSSNLVVGDDGTATLNILEGGAVSNTSATIGADTVAVGTVTVAGAGSSWTNDGTLTVGVEAEGSLTIEAGASVTSSAVSGTPAGILGANAGSTGTVAVTGSGSQWSTGSADLVVGQSGMGDLTIEAGGSVSNRNGFVGRESGGTGVVTVTGTGSNWTNEFLVIGNFGAGTLTVAGGGTVVSHDALIEGAGGTVTINGPGSNWSNANFLSVGHFDTGSLTIENGGLVACARGFIGTGSPTSSGTATVTGAGSAWTNSQVFVVGFEGQAALSILAGGSVSAVDAWIAGAAGSTGTVTVAGAGSRWTISGRLAIDDAFDPDELPAGGTGMLHIQPGGTVTVGGETALFPGATVMLEGGTLDTDSVSFNGGGTFNFLSGTLHVGTYNGNLVNQGGTLAPGHSAGTTTIVGSYTQQAGAELEIEISGTLAGDEYDNVIVTGTATLDGDLSVVLIEGFFPGTSDIFTVLDAASLVNPFDNVANGERLDTADGNGSFVVNYNNGPGTVTLASFALIADYNGDGTVNAADYTVYRNSLHQSGPNLSADGDRDGMVTQLDFEFWKARYGQAVGSGIGASSGTQVPEPVTLAMFALGLASVAPARRRG